MAGNSFRENRGRGNEKMFAGGKKSAKMAFDETWRCDTDMPSPLPPPERSIPMSRVPWVDQEVCISCTLCVQAAPEVFRMNEKNVSEVYNPTGAPEARIQQAIDGCPVSCIQWRE
jgi:ferredoxin